MLAARDAWLTFDDGGRGLHALREVTLELPERGLVGVLGPSGSGKSSLLFVLSGLRRPTRGGVWFADRELSALPEAELSALRRRRFGFVFQRHYLLEYLTVEENARLCASLARSGEDRSAALLERLGLGALRHRRPARLSGGERQRAAVVRALAHAPAVLFADEPTAALDAENRDLVLGLLREEAARGLVLVSTHDESLVEGAARVIRLRDGRLEAGG